MQTVFHTETIQGIEEISSSKKLCHSYKERKWQQGLENLVATDKDDRSSHGFPSQSVGHTKVCESPQLSFSEKK